MFFSYTELGSHVCQAQEQKILQNDRVEPDFEKNCNHQ